MVIASTTTRHQSCLDCLFALSAFQSLHLPMPGGKCICDGRPRLELNRRFTVVVAGAASVLFAVSAHAGPCTTAIAQFERAVRQSANNPDAGPMAPQSIGAQLNRQPTPGSMKRAEERARASFDAVMARAKR